MKASPCTNHTKDSDWETLAQRMKIACLCTLLKHTLGNRRGELYTTVCIRPYYLNRVEHVWKIMDKKQRMDIRKYSFVNRAIKN